HTRFSRDWSSDVCSSDLYFLVDCGEATQIQLRRYHTRFQRIGHIFISHLHGDHFFGLPGLLSTMQLLGRRQELTIWCPGGLIPVMDQMRKISDTRFSFPIHWKATSDDGVHQLFGDDKVEVFSFPLKHRISRSEEHTSELQSREN